MAGLTNFVKDILENGWPGLALRVGVHGGVHFVITRTVAIVVIKLIQIVKICLVVSYVQEFSQLILVGGPVDLKIQCPD